MHDLFKAFLFRLRKDLTFRITLFIGLGLAILISLIFFLVDVAVSRLSSETGDITHIFGTGQSLLLFSLSPAQNFGLAVPINLITFIVLEFTQGTIRNKIIAGNSKAKIYFSLFFSGLLFTLAIMGTYIGICTAFGCIFGGFDAHGMAIMGVGSGNVNPTFIWRILLITVLVYITITSFTLFFAALFRNVGPTIPVVIIVLMACYISATLVGSMGALTELSDTMATFNKVLMYINPLYSMSAFSSVVEGEATYMAISDEALICGVVNNLVYTTAFLVGGMLIFRKRDVK